MGPLVYEFPYALLFWTVFVWVFAPEFVIIRRARHGASETSSPDAGSLRLILFGMNAALVAGFPLASVGALRFPASAQQATFWGGLTLLVAGSLLRRHCWRMLGAHFTGDVRAHSDQPVVTRGAYAFVRHPSYTAGILVFMGIGVALGSWGSAALLTLVAVLVYSYRIEVEERALLETLGDPYRKFMRTRKRLVPYVY